MTAIGIIILAVCAPALADQPAPRAARAPEEIASARRGDAAHAPGGGFGVGLVGPFELRRPATR